jgi:hypothetical protein
MKGSETGLQSNARLDIAGHTKGKPGDKNSATVGVIKVPRLMPLPRERFIATKGSVEDLYYFSLALAPAFQ